ncbi:phosphoglycolate phosphatase [Azospirillaceae bacterium]
MSNKSDLFARLPRAIIYDWDNTLVDTWPTIHAALAETQQIMGMTPWSLEQTRRRVRRALRESFPQEFGARWEEARDIYYKAFAARHLETLKPLDGAASLLAFFAARGVFQAIVSNKSSRFLHAEVESLGWRGFFGRLVGAGDAVIDKPDPAPVVMALEGAGIAPGDDDVWFVGDADVDMECAHRTGCVPVLIGDGFGSTLDAYPPFVRFDNCLAFLDLASQNIASI